MGDLLMYLISILTHLNHHFVSSPPPFVEFLPRRCRVKGLNEIGGTRTLIEFRLRKGRPRSKDGTTGKGGKEVVGEENRGGSVE